MPDISLTVALLLEAAFLLPAVLWLWRCARTIARLEFRLETLEKDSGERDAILTAHLKESAEIRERLVRLETKLDLLLEARPGG